MDEATRMCGEDPDYSKRDLWEHIEKGGKCVWTLKIQTMTPEEATQTSFDPFDVTKVSSSISLMHSATCTARHAQRDKEASIC